MSVAAPAGSRAAGLDRPRAPLRVAYVMSRFPKLSETFVANEILAVERQGVAVEIHPLLRESGGPVHPEAEPLVRRAHFEPFLSPAIIASQVHWLRRRPRAWVGIVRDLVRDTWRSPRLLLGGLAVLPKAAHAARRMEAEGVQHVHCHFATHAAFAGLVAHRLTGLPFSFTAHGFDIHVDRRMLARKVDEAAFVVAISDFNRRVILGETRGRHADRVHVVHCGVDPDRFRPRWATPGVGGETTAEPEATRSVGPAEPPGPPEARPFTVIAVGRLAPVKGHRVLIEACRRLIDEGVSVRCLVAGAGPLRDELAAQALALGLDGRCTLLGGLTAPEVAALMHRADVLVHPSVPTSGNQSEGVPVVLMEAMATGLPVVASRITGIPELVEDGVTGLLVEPGDAAGVAAALRRIHDDPALVALLGRAARERVMADFDLDANAARLADLMRAAATGRDAVATGAPAPVPGMVA